MEVGAVGSGAGQTKVWGQLYSAPLAEDKEFCLSGPPFLDL